MRGQNGGSPSNNVAVSPSNRDFGPKVDKVINDMKEAIAEGHSVINGTTCEH